MRDEPPATPTSTSRGDLLRTNVGAPPAIHVRLAEATDVGAIVPIAAEVQEWHVAGRPDLFKPGGCDTAPEIIARISTPGQFYWVATLGDALVGYAYARIAEEAESRWRRYARMIVLDQMGVAESYRRLGVGQRLWDAVRDVAITEGVERVVLNVWSFNTTARQFYERLGFSSFYERMAVELDPGESSSRR